MMGFFVYLSPDCSQLTPLGKEFNDAYIFVKQLSCGLQHPILLNFTANKDAQRLKLRMGTIRFARLLKSAISLKLAYYENNNLRLFSHGQERRLFGTRSARHYEPVIKQFILIALLKNNFKAQTKAIKCKQRSTANMGAANVAKINTQITLSCRKAASLFNLKSSSHANSLLSKLSPFGLTLTQNKVQISESEYTFHKQTGRHNARYDKLSGQHYFLMASTPTFTHFYKKPLIKQPTIPYYDWDNW